MSVDVIVIIVILVAALGFAIYHFSKPIRGKGGCGCGCGGGGSCGACSTAKTIDNPIGRKTVGIEGMHCDHCKNAVEKEFNKRDGVAAVVDLKKNCAVVTYDKPLDDETIKQLVVLAGFDVTSIEEEVLKKDVKAASKKIVGIEGMHCDHCKNAVEKEFAKHDGVKAAVELKKNRAVVTMETPLDDEEIKKIVDEAGFKVTSIEEG